MSKSMTRKNKLGNMWVALDNAIYSVSETRHYFEEYNVELGFTEEEVADYISTLDDILDKLSKISDDVDAVLDLELEDE